jgi:hypothetical protein
MRRLIRLATAAILVGGGSAAWAQAPLPPVPTMVQLPTFHVFTVQTTVSVPDRGGMSIAGASRGADGRVTRGLGPLANRGGGSSRGASDVSATATIIDSRELDAEVLAAAAGGGIADRANVKAAELSRSVARSASSPLPGSVAAIREQNAAAAEARQAEVATLFAKAQQAEAGGKLDLAKVYYGMVARQATGEVKKLAEARLAAFAASKSTAVAKR